MSNISILVVNARTKFHYFIKSIFILARMKEHSAKDLSFYFMKLPNEQIQCCICGKYFTSGQKCVDHLKSSHSKICEGFIKIKTIDDQSQNNLNRKEEGTRKSNKHGRISCNQCDKKFNLADVMRQHIKTVHEGVMLVCNQCKYQASNRRNLRNHIQYVHKGLRYACYQCEYQTGPGQDKGDLKKHIQSEHEGVRYACNQCSHQSKRQNSLAKHIRSVHEGVKYACNQCDYQATQQSNLTSHVKRKHL